LKDLQLARANDTHLQQLKDEIVRGWPNNVSNLPQLLHEFWNVREDLYVPNDLILMGSHLVIPSSRRHLVMKVVHKGHLGIEKCKARGRSWVYWPDIDGVIEQHVKKMLSV